MSRGFQARATVISIAVVGFFLLNFNHATPKHPREVEFESWLRRIESASTSPSGTKQHPIRVTLNSSYPEFQTDWKLTSGENAAEQRVMRILQLAREGNLFSLGADLPDNLNPAINFLVERENEKFSVAFTREEIDSNIPAQSLIKLFETYAGEQLAPPALTQP